MLRDLWSKFAVLSGAIRELWVIFAVKLLAIFAYGVMNSTVVLWLSSDLGYSDIQAGTIIAVWSTLMTLFTVFVGSLVDAMGLRKALLLGLGICVLTRGIMTFVPFPGAALGLGLFPLALGEALLTPVTVAAIRRYSTTAQRSMAFSIFYAMMNVGFFLSNNVFDLVRKGFGEYGHLKLPALGFDLSTYRVLFLVSFFITIPTFLLLYAFIREGVEATDEGIRFAPVAAKVAPLRRLGQSVTEAGRIFAGLWKQSAFYKFLVFLSLVVAVRLVVYHMHYTYPKFGIRELGEGAPIGRLWSTNPLLIIFLVPIIGVLTQKMAAYRTVIIGSAISAAAVFIMAIPPAVFQSLADGLPGHYIGHVYLGLEGPVHPYYVEIFLFVLVLSVGEAFWSPRLYEYSAAIAPKGQEASYMSLSYLPFFVAKLFVGLFSGFLLAQYCPETGPRNSPMLWLVIALITTITPIGLFVFRRYIQVHEAGRD